MKIVIAGGTGNLGKNLISVLGENHEIIILSRSNNQTLSKNIKIVKIISGAKNFTSIINCYLITKSLLISK